MCISVYLSCQSLHASFVSPQFGICTIMHAYIQGLKLIARTNQELKNRTVGLAIGFCIKHNICMTMSYCMDSWTGLWTEIWTDAQFNETISNNKLPWRSETSDKELLVSM